MNKKISCVVLGYEEGLVGQLSNQLNFKVLFYLFPENSFFKINKKKIKNKPAKNFEYPKNGFYLKKKFYCEKNWVQFLKEKKIKNVLILFSDGKKRLELIKKAEKNKFNVLSFIHKTAFIEKTSKISNGVVIEPLCFVGYKSKIGKGVLVQERSSIEHGVVVKEGVTINPGTVITGNCLIEEEHATRSCDCKTKRENKKRLNYWSRERSFKKH